MGKNDPKVSGFNVIIISLISVLYILMVTKLAEIISLSYEADSQVSTYVMIIYLISIIGIILTYIYLNDKTKQNYQTPNFIVKWGLNIGGVIMLIYTLLNYWDYMGDYAKLSLIALSICCIVYYLYKFYEN